LRVLSKKIIHPCIWYTLSLLTLKQTIDNSECTVVFCISKLSAGMYLDIQNHWVCGLCPSSGILNTIKHNGLYPHKLAITSPTSGGRSVGIVRSRTQTMEFSLVLVFFYKTQCFENWMFPSSGDERETSTLFDPLERSKLNHWTTHVKFKLRVYCDRRSVGQFVLVWGPLWSIWPDFTFSLSDNYFHSSAYRGPSLMRGRVCNLQCNDTSSSSSYIATDGQSASSSLCWAPCVAHDQISIFSV
jgi:hypothetical protein